MGLNKVRIVLIITQDIQNLLMVEFARKRFFFLKRSDEIYMNSLSLD